MYLSSRKQSLVVLIFLYNVSSSYVWGRYRYWIRDTGSDFIPLEEYERRFRVTQDPDRIKTYTSEAPSIITKITGAMVNNSHNPCDPYNPPERNFSTQGRRISEIKCMEYMWDLKLRHEKFQRAKECRKEKRRIRLKEQPEDPLHPIRAVFGGIETYPGEYSHMGAIGWLAIEGTWIFKCGSSLISHNFVLTAAHCSSTSRRDPTVADIVPKIVRLGDKNILDDMKWGPRWPQKDINISRIIVHPKYVSPYHYYDIALIELKDKVIFNKHIQPACLWQKLSVSELGKQGIVTGWGVVESNRDVKYSPILLAAKIDFLDTDECNNYLERYQNRHFKGVVDHQICAGKLTGGVDACQGDSGGPLQVQIPIPVYSQGKMHYLVGVVSFSIGCGLENIPGIYTRVSAFIDWIEPIVWPNNADP